MGEAVALGEAVATTDEEAWDPVAKRQGSVVGTMVEATWTAGQATAATAATETVTTMAMTTAIAAATTVVTPREAMGGNDQTPAATRRAR